ncbi:MAG: OB-fold putative lipoprotein [Planctomycetes bacterium]|nr:OB-fold putative lipoprotein [Planctomycetota bacterium]MCD7897495.1 OB-fold putative lipoprotein [Planctomycetaceae bacterium]
MGRRRRAWCLAVILLATAGAASAQDVDAVTSASIDATTGASATVDPIQISDNFSVAYAVNDDGALFVLAADLAGAYGRDELQSDALFKGKIVQVKGVVEKMSKPDAARPWLTLAGDGESGKTVRCSLRAGQLAGKTIHAGDTVQVRGVCDGMKLSVSVQDGELVE